MGTVTTDDLLITLNDVDFPVSKEDLVIHAEHKGVSDPAVKALRALPLGTYDNKQQVLQSIDVTDDDPDASTSAAQARSNATSRIAKSERPVEPSPIDAVLEEDER